MTCTVRIASPLRSYTAGAATLTAHGSSLAEVLASLEQRCPGIRFRMIDEQDQIRAHMRFFVNGAQVFDMAHALRASDAVQIVQALSGG